MRQFVSLATLAALIGFVLLAGAGSAAAAKTAVSYHGGPVMRTTTVYAVYWNPAGTTMQAGYQATIDRYLTDVATDKGSTTNVYSVATQYSDTTGSIANNSTFGGSTIDTDSFPASGCKYPKKIGISVCLTEAQLYTELSSVVQSNGWPRGGTTLYLLLLPENVGACQDPGGDGSGCGGKASDRALTSVCGWHTEMPYNSPPSETPIAIIPYAQSNATGLNPATGCAKGGESPNGNDSDAAINIISHETNEAITNPFYTGWYIGTFPTNYSEIGDLCAWKFGTPVGGAPGAEYNQVINGDHYWLQEEWSNATSSCSLGVGTSTGKGVIVFDGSAGTGPPPATLGGYTMKPFATDPTPNGTPVISVTGPTSILNFSATLTHLLVGNGWATWSNGYAGDVYDTATDGSVTSILITLPAKTHAFYLYAEPNTFASFVVSATADDGTSSGPIDVQGNSGAQYYGFYSSKKARFVKSILITCADPTAEGFAVGEFGIG